MNRIIVLCMLIFCSNFSFAQLQWSTFTSPDNSFSILFPEKPREEVTRDDTSKITYVAKNYMTSLIDEKFIFLAGTVQYGESYIINNEAELNANRDNFCKAVKATVLYTKNITLNGNPGIEFTAKSTDYFFKSQVYMVGRMPFMIAVMVSGDKSTPEVDKFIQSFKILK